MRYSIRVGSILVLFVAALLSSGCRQAAQEKPKPPALTPTTVIKGDNDLQAGWLVASSDGKILAFMNRVDGSIRVWDVEAGKERETLKGVGKWFGLTFVPGTHTALVATQSGALELWNTDTGVKDRTLDWTAQPGSSYAVSSDRKMLAIGRTGGTDILSFDNGKLIKTLPGRKEFHVRAVAFSADNKHLYSGGDPFNEAKPCAVRRWNTKTWDETEPIRRPDNSSDAEFISTDPKGVLVVHASGIRIMAFDLAAKKQKFSVLRGTAPPVFSPDGGWLLWAEIDNLTDLGRRIEADANKDKNQDGDWVDTVQLRLYDVANDKHHTILHKLYSRIWKVVFCGENSFATLHDDNSVQIWSLST